MNFSIFSLAKITFWLVSILLMLQVFVVYFPHSRREGLIIDTDMFSDVGDAGALLLVCSTNNNTNILAVNINQPSVFSAIAVLNMLGYNNLPQVPVGIRNPRSNLTYLDTTTFEHGEYASKIMHHWKGYRSPLFQRGEDWIFYDPVRLYRQSLARAKPHGVKIASIGLLDNLADLLDSPGDRISNMTGYELVRQKVNDLVIMGGEYPSGLEDNSRRSPGAAAKVVLDWPSKIVFSGSELGRDVFSGAKFTTQGNASDPVRTAYEWYRYAWPLLCNYSSARRYINVKRLSSGYNRSIVS
ncbi:inosine/uridine-preferring nucleoside hydrolase [Aspergillus affinis]|uniref:inosine/uridine-preferring nucleoside hydrolase n=1 Tax=Aspergillus affinis TaxID=1070780 RepID=UPI0022FF3866|nr:inosine/uridine-preferring nucleoside hydrolase [Aspergillus affinis]KAI9037476.1 inosine/uridine-preferring nucleoside hydrolase [Aspergillus affinis]